MENEINIYKNSLSKYVGELIKYKDLCTIINEERATGGKYKELHLKRLSQYMDIRKSNGKLIIYKLYDENEIRLAESQGKFTTYIQNYLIKILKNSKETKVTYTYRELIERLSMVNSDFYDGKYNHWQYIDEFTDKKQANVVGEELSQKMLYGNMSLFFNTTNRLLKTTVDDALKSMQKRSLITANKNFRLYRRTPIQQDDKVIYIMEHKDCTDDEHSQILDIRKQTMEWFNFTHPKSNVKQWSDLYYLSYEQRNIFFTYFKCRLKETLEYDVCADTYDIIIGKEAINIEYNKLYKLDYLNGNVQNKILNAKDLNKINEVLKASLVDRFIRK